MANDKPQIPHRREGSFMEDLGFEVVHIGFNQKDAAEAKKTADLLESLFGFQQTDTPKSVFSTQRIEIMKSKGAGMLGHVAIGTNDVPKAKKYLESKGVEFDEGNASYDKDGRIRLIYMKNEIAGFAFHLFQK